MANYPDDKERETIYYEAPDEHWNAYVDHYYGYKPAESLVGTRCKKRQQRQNAKDVLFPIGQESTQNCS